MNKLLSAIFALAGIILLIPPFYYIITLIKAIGTNSVEDALKFGVMSLGVNILQLLAIMGFGLLITAFISDLNIKK